MSTAKIRINLSLREFEIEGTEDFINSHSEKIDSFLDLLKNTPPSPVPQIVQQPLIVSSATAVPRPSIGGVPDTFGEYFHQLPKNSKDIDKILLAGHFTQVNSPDNSFKTKDANQLLLDLGVRLSNPSVFMSKNVDSKRVIKIGGKQFRLSTDGVDHLQVLFNGAQADE